MKFERPYQASRVDANQAEIVHTFRKLGGMVVHLHTVGQGCFDLILAVDFLNIFVEVKNYKKSPSARELTPAQKKWNFSWVGLRVVVTTKHEAIQLMAAAHKFVAEIYRVMGKDKLAAIRGCDEKQYQPSLY
jgi:hypothetical protein